MYAIGAALRLRKRAALGTSRRASLAGEPCPEAGVRESTLLHCAFDRPGEVISPEERLGAVAVCSIDRNRTLHVVSRIRRLARDAYLIVDVRAGAGASASHIRYDLPPLYPLPRTDNVP